MKLFTIRVRGQFALFCPAWLRAEPCSEPGPTPSALSGIYRALYRKPQFEWCISRYRWAKPIRYETLKRSGVDRDAFTSEYGRWTDRSGPIDRESGKVQQIQTVLRDVDYIVDGYVALNRSAMDPARGRTLQDVERIVEHYMKTQSVFGVPCGGRSEFMLDVEYLEEPYDGPVIADSMDLGPMLVGLTPTEDGGSLLNRWRPHYTRLRMEAGTVVVPSEAYRKILPALDREAGGLAAAGRFVVPTAAPAAPAAFGGDL